MFSGIGDLLRTDFFEFLEIIVDERGKSLNKEKGGKNKKLSYVQRWHEELSLVCILLLLSNYTLIFT